MTEARWNGAARERRVGDVEASIAPLARASGIDESATIVYEGPVRRYAAYEDRYYRQTVDGRTTAA